MVSRKATKEMLEDLETIPHYALGDALDQMLFWEVFGFGEWTVTDVADFLMDYIKNKRKKGG